MSLPSHLEQLRLLNERARVIHDRLIACADTFEGPLPTAPSRGENATLSTSFNEQFAANISELNLTLDAIASELARIEEQVYGKKAASATVGGLY